MSRVVPGGREPGMGSGVDWIPDSTCGGHPGHPGPSRPSSLGLPRKAPPHDPGSQQYFLFRAGAAGGRRSTASAHSRQPGSLSGRSAPDSKKRHRHQLWPIGGRRSKALGGKGGDPRGRSVAPRPVDAFLLGSCDSVSSFHPNTVPGTPSLAVTSFTHVRL